MGGCGAGAERAGVQLEVPVPPVSTSRASPSRSRSSPTPRVAWSQAPAGPGGTCWAAQDQPAHSARRPASGPRDAAPSHELRRWFGHDPTRWTEFRRRYTAELDAYPDSWRSLLDVGARDDLLLLYGVKDTRNNAVVLRDHLEQHLARARQATADGAGGNPAYWLRWVCPGRSDLSPVRRRPARVRLTRRTRCDLRPGQSPAPAPHLAESTTQQRSAAGSRRAPSSPPPTWSARAPSRGRHHRRGAGPGTGRGGRRRTAPGSRR